MCACLPCFVKWKCEINCFVWFYPLHAVIDSLSPDPPKSVKICRTTANLTSGLWVRDHLSCASVMLKWVGILFRWPVTLLCSDRSSLISVCNLQPQCYSYPVRIVEDSGVSAICISTLTAEVSGFIENLNPADKSLLSHTFCVERVRALNVLKILG